MSFAETIRRYRKERGWTLEALSKRAGLSVAQLSKLETGKSEPSIDSLRKLAAVYGNADVAQKGNAITAVAADAKMVGAVALLEKR